MFWRPPVLPLPPLNSTTKCTPTLIDLTKEQGSTTPTLPVLQITSTISAILSTVNSGSYKGNKGGIQGSPSNSKTTVESALLDKGFNLDF